MCMVWFYKLFKFKVLNYVFLMTKACILYKFFGIFIRLFLEYYKYFQSKNNKFYKDFYKIKQFMIQNYWIFR